MKLIQQLEFFELVYSHSLLLKVQLSMQEGDERVHHPGFLALQLVVCAVKVVGCNHEVEEQSES